MTSFYCFILIALFFTHSSDPLLHYQIDTQIRENHAWELSNAASYYSTSRNDPLQYESQFQ